MSKLQNFSHENFDRPEKINLGSERSFGLTFAALFLLISLWPVFTKQAFKATPLYLSLFLLFVSVACPNILKWPNFLWLKLGLLLNKIISPIVLLLLFIFAFSPLGLLLRLFGKDVLKLKIDKSAKSYWLNSETDTSNMKNQF
ncbi:hypothetical protein K2P97_00135 [bacterium]|nr:hypothetical protein [bacterium]